MVETIFLEKLDELSIPRPVNMCDRCEIEEKLYLILRGGDERTVMQLEDENEQLAQELEVAKNQIEDLKAKLEEIKTRAQTH